MTTARLGLAACLAAVLFGCDDSPASTSTAPTNTETRSDLDAGAALTAGASLEDPGLVRAETQRRLGQSLSRQGRLKEALPALETALVLFREHGNARQQAQTLNDLGDVLFLLGEFSLQEHAQWRALELAESAGHCRAAATAWNNLGVSFAARGLPSAALDAYGRSLDLRCAMADRYGKASEAATFHNLGVQFLQLGRVREGVDKLRRAVFLHRESSGPTELGQSQASLAWGLALDGDPEAALATYAEALSHFTEAGADHDLAIALEQRAQLFRRLGHLTSAHEDLERSLALIDAGGGSSRLDAAYLQLGLGAVLREQGRTAEAMPLLRQSTETFEDLKGQEGRVLSRLELARLLRTIGAHDEAIAQLEAALDIVESARADLYLPAFRITYLGGWQDVYLELVDLLAEAALDAPNRRTHRIWAARAFAVAERARARALLDSLAASPPARESSFWNRSPKLETLRHRVEELEALALERNGDTPDHASRDLGLSSQTLSVLRAPTEEPLRALRRARIELERAQESEWRAARRRPPIAEPKAIDLIQSHIDAETVLLAYALGAKRSWLWRIDRQGVEVWPLAPGPEIEAAARDAYQLLPLSQRRGFRKAARAAREHLAELVLRPAARTLERTRIAVVPDGALHLVPFTTLPLSSEADGTLRPLTADYEVVHLPSASALVELRRRRTSRSPAPHMLALVVDPVFELDDPRLGAGAESHIHTEDDPGAGLARTRRALGGRLGRLLGSAEEAAQIVEIARRSTHQQVPQIYDAFGATRELVTSGALGGFRMVHFATHGLIDTEDPALAGLVLSLYHANGRPRDGLLRTRDLHELQLPVDLVVLSACRTALGQEIRGEGVVGLAEGFFAAGASLLVVSMWDVDDQATAAFMSRFYAHLLLDRRHPADALRHAQSELRNQTKWRSPAHWGAFVALGDWQVGVD